MDGDIAPLADYAELAARHGAELIVDDAHACGLFGAERGSGLVEEPGSTACRRRSSRPAARRSASRAPSSPARGS